MTYILGILALAFGVAGIGYFWNKILTAHRAIKAQRLRQQMTIVIDGHKETKKKLDKEVEEFNEAIDDYIAGDSIDVTPDGPGD